MPRYEAGLRMLMQCGDRSAQVEVLLGMSRTMVLMQQLGESPPVCECKVHTSTTNPVLFQHGKILICIELHYSYIFRLLKLMPRHLI